MRILFISIAVVLFYNCAEKKKTALATVDSSGVVLHTNTFDGGFSTLGEESRNSIVYDSTSSMYCKHENLSTQFDFQLYLNRYTCTEEYHDSCTVKLIVLDKKNKQPCDSIQLYSNFYDATIFTDCKHVRSYSTQFNVNEQVVDNYYGDIIVADFNFDNREDVALINDMGGNAGSLYSFFIQNTDRKFVKDPFLTDSMEFFPSKIDKVHKRLTTYVHAGVCGLGEHIYVFNDTCWKQQSHKIINICKD
jgi:hypothetical protein